jgi:hypothetical protein
MFSASAFKKGRWQETGASVLHLTMYDWRKTPGIWEKADIKIMQLKNKSKRLTSLSALDY